ncbi:MAG: hypothetical protein JJU16_08825 [Alkalibacterium sp.]|nr:hypothetical protein [Alkalibacterium sp.]
MIIEALIAHIVGYFYFTRYPTFLANSKNAEGHSQYSWGIFFTSLVIFGLIEPEQYLSWLSISVGLVLGHALFRTYIMEAIDMFLSSTIQYNRTHALQTFYKKNGQIIAFSLHQMLFIFWITLMNQLLFIWTQPLTQIFFIIISTGLLILKTKTSVTWLKENRRSVLQTLTSYIVLSALALFISQLMITVISVVDTGPQPLIILQNRLPYEAFLQTAFILILLMRPANLIIRTLSVQYDPKGNERKLSDTSYLKDAAPLQESGFKGAGAMIGNLERILIFLSFVYGSLLSVVAILSIKAFARYKLIADDPYFSEYFVIGTMLSVLITFVSYIGLMALTMM